MPRAARARSASGIYHVMVRGIRGENIFLDNTDLKAYLKTLTRVKDDCGIVVYGYCLMDNHVHILLGEGQESLGASMRRIGVSYAVGFNNKYGRTGYLFQNRFRSEPVEDDAYFMTVLRYIHQNPVKAGLCQQCGAYPWSSYRAYANRQGRVELVDVRFALNLMGGLSRFLQFTNAPNDDKCLDIVEKRRLSDDELRGRLEDLLADFNKATISALTIPDRNRLLRHLKKMEGTTLAQIAAVTGLSKNIVARA